MATGGFFWAPHVHVENAAEGFPGSAAHWNGVLEALASLKRRPRRIHL